MDEAQKTPTSGRYSLRARTPVVKQEQAPTVTPTPRKRARTISSTSKAVKEKVTPRSARKTAQPTLAKPRGRGRGRRNSVLASTSRGRRPSAAARTASAADRNDSSEEEEEEEEEEDDGIDAAAVSSEDEDYSSTENESTNEETNGKWNGGNTEAQRNLAFGRGRASSHGAVSVMIPTVPARRGPGRPRKGEESRAAKASGTPTTPAKKSWEIRRIPVHLTKHDAFRPEYLEEVIRTMQTIPITGMPNEDRYELMKMSDALKLCGYELGVVDPTTAPFFEVYRLLSWAVHAAGPNGPAHPSPPLTDEAKGILLRVFASIGRRIREETKDMAGYHRRHVLRKLMLAESMEADRASSVPMAMDDEYDAEYAESRTPREQPVNRRNPLKIPGSLIDIWRELYKKNTENDGHESQTSDA